MQSRGGKNQKREGKKKEDQRRERVRRKKMQVRNRKVAIHCVLPMICGSGRSKSRLAKAADAEPSGGMRDENLHTIVARSRCGSQHALKTPQVRSTFGS